jgi:hypothetical protein
MNRYSQINIFLGRIIFPFVEVMRQRGKMKMYCELLNKDVEITVAKEFRSGKDNNIVQTFYECSGCFIKLVELVELKCINHVDVMSDAKCLLKHM